jgi:hypothetical protein
MIFVIGAVVLFCVGSIAAGGEEFPLLGRVGMSIVAILAGLLAIAILVAARQSAFLLIDISDTLLHENSKNA